MHKIITALLSLLLLVTAVEVRHLKRPPAANVESLREASFMVRTVTSSGSGTVFRDSHGELLILTAAHIFKEETQVLLIQTTVIAGERLSGVSIDGDVIAVDRQLDLALIRPHSALAFSIWNKHVATIYKGKEVPGLMTPVIHIGSRLGGVGERSVSMGIVSGLARPMTDDGQVLDQVTAPASSGSSGGGIFDSRTGQLIGVLVRGYTDTFSFFVPARHIRIFLKNTQH